MGVVDESFINCGAFSAPCLASYASNAKVGVERAGRGRSLRENRTDVKSVDGLAWVEITNHPASSLDTQANHEYSRRASRFAK
jgi:hypothetical protein